MRKLLGLVVIAAVLYGTYWMMESADKSRQKELDEIATFLASTDMSEWDGARAKRDAKVYMNDTGVFVNFREKTYEAKVMPDGSVMLLENGKVVAQSRPFDTNKNTEADNK